jgi:hypothetical protein
MSAMRFDIASFKAKSKAKPVKPKPTTKAEKSKPSLPIAIINATSNALIKRRVVVKKGGRGVISPLDV